MVCMVTDMTHDAFVIAIGLSLIGYSSQAGISFAAFREKFLCPQLQRSCGGILVWAVRDRILKSDTMNVDLV